MNKRKNGEINLWVSIAIMVSILVVFLVACLIIKKTMENPNNHDEQITSGDEQKSGDENHSQSEIENGVYEKPTIIGDYVYTGRSQTVKLNGYNENAMKQSNTTRKNAGSQDVTISLRDTSRSEWDDNTVETLKLNWVIKKAPITIEWSNLEIRYDGENHVPIAIATGLANDKLGVDVSGAGSSEGEHTAVATLTGSVADNYEITNPTVQYKIIKESGDISVLDENIILSRYSFVYSGSANEPSVRIKANDTWLEEGTDYTLRYENNVNVGTGRVIIIGKGKNFTGRMVKEFTITRNPNASVTSEDKVYNGNTQTGITGRNVDLTGDVNKKDIGTYTVIATPMNGYAWTDGTYDAKELTWKIKDGIKVGDYVSYTPVGKNGSKLSTENKLWRILSIDNGVVLITTYGAVNQNEVTLTGSDGYVNVAEKLDKLCEDAYSNTSKGLRARSMTIEDLNAACQYSKPAPKLRYAYYLSTDSGTISQNGNTYVKAKHSNKLYGISEPSFYSYEENNIIRNVTTPKKLTNDGPIYLTENYYTYNPSNASVVKNAIAGEVLGTGDGWLASKCVRLDTTVANFCVYYANANEVASKFTYSSNGYSYSPALGIRPVVSINSNRLDIENANSNGSTVNPWHIK